MKAKEALKNIGKALINTVIALAIILITLVLISNVKSKQISNNVVLTEEPTEIERIHYYTDKYSNCVTRIMHHSETLDGEGLVREINLSKEQKEDLDSELLKDKVMLESVAYKEVERFRLITEDFLTIMEKLALKETVTVQDSHIAADWWEIYVSLLDNYYTAEERAERLK